ncbi:hypothetical protein MMC31_006922 [Peltigera leucophlebia]|nr:hypothetical protein [Peltigera leucophlebia]
MDLTSGLGIDVSEVGSLESWVEQAEESGWHVFLDDDEDCEGNEMDSTESQQVTGKSAEVTSGNMPSHPTRTILASNTHHLDLYEGSLITKSQEGCVIEERLTDLSGRCSKRRRLA